MAPKTTKKTKAAIVRLDQNNNTVVLPGEVEQMDVCLSTNDTSNRILFESNERSVINDQEQLDQADGNDEDGMDQCSNRSSHVWKYMTKVDDKAKCNLCGVILRRKNGNTSGLRKHLHQVHKKEKYSISSVKKSEKSNRISADEKRKLDVLLIKCIIEDGRSFSDIRRPGLLKVLCHLVPGYIPPYRHTVQRRLHSFYLNEKRILVKELETVDSIAVTCDLWSDKRLYSYICLTGHYITPKFEFVSKIISFSSFYQRHYATNISSAVREQLKELNIYDKTTTITTDGASNMVKMFEMIDPKIKRVYCFAHRLHLIVCNSLGLWIRKKKKSNMSSGTTASESEPDDSDEDDLTDDVSITSPSLSRDDVTGQNEKFDELSNVDDDTMSIDSGDGNDIRLDNNEMEEEHEDDSIDVIDNWSQDVIEEFDPSNCEAEHEIVGALMKKCRSLVKLINKSSILKSHVNKLKRDFNIQRSLQLDCKSRWNSTFRLIETFVEYKKIINKLNSEKHDIGLNYKQTKKLSSIELDKSDWNFIESIKCALEPFAHATTMTSASQYPTIGTSFFAIVQIREYLEDTKSTGSNGSNILPRLRQLLLYYIDKYFEKDDKQWQLIKEHAYFDPLGYGSLTRFDRRIIERNLREQYKEASNTASHITQDMPSDSFLSNAYTKRTSKRPKSSSMANFLESLDKNSVSSQLNTRSRTKGDFDEELCTYRSLAQKEFNEIVSKIKESNTMQFWQLHRYELKIMSQFASRFLSSPSTSVPSESAFSTASFVLSKQRSRLSPSNLSLTVFLKDKINKKSNLQEGHT